MSVEPHIRRGHPITFGLIIFFGIIELSLSAWLTSQYNTHHNYSSLTERDRVRFILFACTWTIILSVFYLALFLHSPSGSMATSVLSHLVFLTFTWVIWTAAAAAVTQLLGGGLNCNKTTGFTFCGQMNALEGFAWVEWILVTFAIVVVIVRGISAARRGDGLRGHLIA